jgi:hypothetical protein
VRFEGGTLRFVNQFPGPIYEGELSADGNSINGTVQQGYRQKRMEHAESGRNGKSNDDLHLLYYFYGKR